MAIPTGVYGLSTLVLVHAIVDSLQLSGKRRVTISEFKKQTYINLREYWVDNSGDWKPGKKVRHRPPGIPLTATDNPARASPSLLTSTTLSSRPSPRSMPSWCLKDWR
jgi:hypothetical protein